MLRKQTTVHLLSVSNISTLAGLRKGSEEEKSPRRGWGTQLLVAECWKNCNQHFMFKGGLTAQYQTGKSFLPSKDQIFFSSTLSLLLLLLFAAHSYSGHCSAPLWVACTHLPANNCLKHAEWLHSTRCGMGTLSKEERGMKAEPCGSFLLHLFSFSAVLSIEFNTK